MRQKTLCIALLASIILTVSYAKAQSAPYVAMYVKHGTQDTVFFFVMSPDIPVNALSLQMRLDASCGPFAINEALFPLILENQTINETMGTEDKTYVDLQIASMEKDINGSLLGSISCKSVDVENVYAENTSEAYIADGYGTPLPLSETVKR